MTSLCECGGEKARTAPACDQCMWRDGSCTREARIIDALRTAVAPIDVRQLASLSATTERSVLRSVGTLIDTERVIKTTGRPTLYRLGEKEKMGKAATAKQGQLEGFERPCIEELDRAIADFVDADAQLKEWKYRRDEAKRIVDEKMLANELDLEHDDEGDKVYVYQDGSMRHVATLPAEELARHAKVTSKKIPRAELEDAE